ncbi:MAG TPA: hypothetical protein VIT45_06185 [Allosphingosinicella sp.]
MADTQSADVLQSWQEAVVSCGSLEWENLCLEAANQYRARVDEKSPDILQAWNEAADAFRPIVNAFVDEKTAKVVAENNLPKDFVDTVRWDIIHLCLEAEFADIYPPGFFASQSYWYFVGHFPCGWRGTFPAGRMVIY